MATLKPSPSAPRRFATGTRTLSKIDVADVGALLAHLLLGLADREAGQVALAPGRPRRRGARLVRIGARHHREEVGLVGVGDEALGAVQDVVVAVADRRGSAPRRCRSRRSGSVSAKRGDDLAARRCRGSHFAFCASVPNITRPWLPMPTLVPKAERKAGMVRPELDGDQALLLHGEAEAAVFLRDREAEQAQRPASRATTSVGHRVVLGDLGLQRPQPLGDEAADGVDQLRRGFRGRGPLSHFPHAGCDRHPPSFDDGQERKREPVARLPFDAAAPGRRDQ